MAGAVDRTGTALAAARGKPQIIDDGTWLTLPREGRTANAPAWPLSTPTKREREIWAREWKRPQALAWERVGVSFDTVALYVRYLAEAEQVGATIGVRNRVASYAGELGLTAAGMRMLRWRVARPHQEIDQPAASTPAATPGRASAQDRRARFTVVRGAG